MTRFHDLAARLLLAVEVAGFLGLLYTLVLAGAFAGHVWWGVPTSLERLPRLQGPPGLVAVGLALQAFVCLTVLTAARRRRQMTVGKRGQASPDV